MNLEIFNQILESFVILKVGLLILIAFHTVFLFIVYTQVKSMNRVITEEKASHILQVISLLTIAVSAFLFVVSVVIL